jgi:hypothetical protein
MERALSFLATAALAATLTAALAATLIFQIKHDAGEFSLPGRFDAADRMTTTQPRRCGRLNCKAQS